MSKMPLRKIAKDAKKKGNYEVEDDEYDYVAKVGKSKKLEKAEKMHKENSRKMKDKLR